MSTQLSSTPTPDRDDRLLSIGEQCHQPHCLTVDFLPFKCQHCKHSFCQEHFKVEVHQCPNFDEKNSDRIAPSCPLCNIGISIPRGQDPNIAMNTHLESECSVVTGKARTRSLPVCSRKACQKVLFQPIRCEKCRKQYCPSHRFPSDHTCTPIVASAPTSKSSVANTLANINAGAKNLNTKASIASSAAVVAVKKSIANASIPTNTSTTPSKPVLPFNKMDRISTSHPSTSNYTIPINSSHVTTVPPTTHDTNDDIIKPSPIINPLSFVPRSIFASA